jgi:serine/threonine protein kinase
MSNVHDTKQTETFEVGNYIVYDKAIGKGASGIIFKGYHKGTKQDVAVKEIREPNLHDIKRNIKTEIKLMKRLKHPNIVELYDVVLDYKKSAIYLVIEYCPQGDFSNFQRRKAIQEVHVQKYMKQLMLGLKYLKENNIMHRDLKPQNILISKEGNLKLTDFGYAKVVNGTNAMIKTFCGSPLYMAPEIIKSKGVNDYSTKADLWSVGCIFYEMLTGYPPFYVSSMANLIKMIDENDIIIPKALNVSSEAKELLFSLLQVDPQKRINWNEFFAHEWLQKDLLIDEENKLLAFDISDDFATDLPSISQYRRNTKIFISTHLTDSEKARFKLKDKSVLSTQPSITYKSNNGYCVVGTPPQRVIENEKMDQLKMIIEQKVESNTIQDRNINDINNIYDKHKSTAKTEQETLEDDELFYSCESALEKSTENGGEQMIDSLNYMIQRMEQNIQETETKATSNPIPIPGKQHYQSELKTHKQKIVENDLEEAINTSFLPSTKLIIETSNYAPNYFGSSKFSVEEFSTSLISTGHSIMTEKTDAYVIIDNKLKTKPIMKSDQHEYRKNKINKFFKSSIGFFKGSLDYINSYGNSM